MLNLASQVAKRIKKHWSGNKNWKQLQDTVAQLGKEPTPQVAKVKSSPVPVFFEVSHSALSNVAHKGWEKKKPPAEWSSHNFILQVYNGPIAEAKSPDLKTNLRHFVNTLLPGYHKFLGAGFNVDQLMSHNGRVADLCFLEAVWRYTRCVGLDSFPCGLYTWPPVDDEAEDAAECLPKAATHATGGSGTSCGSDCKGCPACKPN